MKQIIQLGQQLAAAWREFGLNQRISVVTTAVLVVGFLLGLAMWSGKVDYGLLYSELEGQDASKVIGVLDGASVPYRIGEGGSIFVPKDKVHSMRIQLASQNLPSGGKVGLELFNESTIGMSDVAVKLNVQRAIQGELARTISQMDRVDSAEVMLVMPENRLLIDDTRRPSASVFVRARGTLPESTVLSIQSLVAHSVAGLEASEVSVVDNAGHVLSGSGEETFAGLTSTQLEVQKEIENYLEKKAVGMLDTVLGKGQSVVRVAARLNFDQLSVQNETYDPDSQVMRSSMTDNETVRTEGAAGQGMAAGIVPNANTSNTNSSGVLEPGVMSHKTSIQNEYAFTKVLSNLTINPGGLEELSAAVFVAMRYTGEEAERAPEPRSAAELDILRRSVISALGLQATPGATNLVTLEEIEFSAPVTSLADTVPVIQPNYWISQLPKLLYPGLAIGMFLIFLRMLKKTPLEEIPLVSSVRTREFTPRAMTPASSEPQEGNRVADFNAQAAQDQRIVTVEVFNQLVKENPNNMTQAIQAWLGHSSSSKN